MSEHQTPPSHGPEQQDVPVRDDLSEEQDTETNPDVDISEDMPGYKIWRYLRFIKLREESGEKRPAVTWGGYSEQFDANSDVYSVQDVAASNHDRWGVVGFEAPENAPTNPNLIVIDLDLHKDGAPDRSDIGISREGAMLSYEPVIVESQSGGVHLYALVDQPAVKESEFDVPWWVDLRGQAVKHHVVAPTETPGVDTAYELRNDASMPEFGSYQEFAEMVTVDGEQIIEYEGSLSGPSETPEYDGDAPADMPTCYQQALAARADAEFREAHGNPWKVDTLAAQLGIALGYDVETVADHFEAHPKGGDASEFDRNLTVSHLQRLAGKMRGDGAEGLRAPSALTLRGHGVLDAGESCSCDLHQHHDPDASGCSEFYAYLRESYDRDEDLLRACLEARDEHADELADAKPPYAALREIARRADLPMEDDGTLGEYSWSVAKSAFEEMDASEV